MRSKRSAQRQVELRRLINQHPVFGKANSLCKVVTFVCFACLRLSAGRGINICRVRVIVARAKVPVVPPGSGKKY